MKRTELPPKLRRMLTTVPYVTIASICPNGRPWNTPVWGVFDNDLTLYWASWPNNQHSRNIAADPHIFVVVYDSRAKEGEGVGIYLEMEARMVRGTRAVTSARRAYTTAFGETLAHEPFVGACPRRLYAAELVRAWQNSDGYINGNFVDVRLELAPRVAQ